MNHLLRYSGHNPAEAFNRRLIDRMRQATANGGRVAPEGPPSPAGFTGVAPADVRRYLQEDDE